MAPATVACASMALESFLIAEEYEAGSRCATDVRLRGPARNAAFCSCPFQDADSPDPRVR